MNDTNAEYSPGGLSQVDKIAIGLGVTIMFATYFWPPIGFLVAYAIFLPPVLREFGLLKDYDRRKLDAMRRAGLHALLVLVAMFLISHQLVRNRIIPETDMSATPILNETYLRGLLVGTYLVSLLLQVLGPRKGSMGVLLGTAVIVLAPLPAQLSGAPAASLPMEGAAVLAIPAVLLASLALVVRNRPFLGGRILVGLFVLGSAAVVGLGSGRMPIESILSTLLQIGLLFGCTGYALLRRRP